MRQSHGDIQHRFDPNEEKIMKLFKAKWILAAGLGLLAMHSASPEFRRSGERSQGKQRRARKKIK